MQMTEEGLALIRRFEGFRGEAYRCPAGVWTIGYGHTSQAGAPAVRPGMVVGEEEAMRILACDVERFGNDVAALLVRPISAAQFSALVSFAYNVGITAFRRSSVLKAVNDGRFADVPAALKLWVKGGGRVLPGLERRRAAEAELFLSETLSQAGRAQGAPRSVAPERRLRAAGLMVLLAALVGAVSPWLLLGIVVAGAVAVAAWLYLGRRRLAGVA